MTMCSVDVGAVRVRIAKEVAGMVPPGDVLPGAEVSVRVSPWLFGVLDGGRRGGRLDGVRLVPDPLVEEGVLFTVVVRDEDGEPWASREVPR